MYSVRDVAKELNISRQAVYKKLSKDSLKDYIVIVDGVKYLTDDGLLFLKSLKESENQKTSEIFNEESLVNILNDVIKSKDRDIDYLRDKNEKLLELIKQQNQLLNNSQNNEQIALSNTEILLLEKRQQLLLREVEYKLSMKKSFKERLKFLFTGN